VVGATQGLQGVSRLPLGYRFAGEARLAREAAGGDGQAFAAIYSRYHQPLYRYCLSILHNPEDAQDALQNAMLKALRGLAGRDREAGLRPWLFRIAHNESVSILRRRSAGRRAEPETQIAPADTEVAEVSRARLQELVEDLRSLPERPRGALVMRELVGLEYEEIGVALSISPGAARQMVYQARAGLHELAKGREMPCEDVRQSLSDGDRRRFRSRRLRAHLRECRDCREFGELMAARRHELAALTPPLPAAAAASVLHAVLSSGGGGPGGGLLAGLGGGASKVAGASTGVKGLAATAAIVTTAAVGTAVKAEQEPEPGRQATPSPAPMTGDSGANRVRRRHAPTTSTRKRTAAKRREKPEKPAARRRAVKPQNLPTAEIREVVQLHTSPAPTPQRSGRTRYGGGGGGDLTTRLLSAPNTLGVTKVGEALPPELQAEAPKLPRPEVKDLLSR
jgi:RNA polymerase sigma factor (sigma-70 family)